MWRTWRVAASGVLLSGAVLVATGSADQHAQPAPAWRLAGASSTGIAHGDLDGNGVPGLSPANPHDFNLTAVVTDVTGKAEPFSLYPGAHATVVVTVWNNKNGDMQVNTVAVAPGNATAGCDASNLSAGTFTGAVFVPRGGTATVDVPLTMSTDAPDACKDVSFPLALSGTGGKA